MLQTFFLKFKSNQIHGRQIQTISNLIQCRNVKFKSNQILVCKIQTSNNLKHLKFFTSLLGKNFEKRVFMKQEYKICYFWPRKVINLPITDEIDDFPMFEVKLKFLTSNSNIFKCCEKLFKSNQIKFQMSNSNQTQIKRRLKHSLVLTGTV